MKFQTVKFWTLIAHKTSIKKDENNRGNLHEYYITENILANILCKKKMMPEDNLEIICYKNSKESDCDILETYYLHMCSNRYGIRVWPF